MGFHQEPPESPALYSEISAAKLARGCPLEIGYQSCTRKNGGYGFRNGELVLWDAVLGNGRWGVVTKF